MVTDKSDFISLPNLKNPYFETGKLRLWFKVTSAILVSALLSVNTERTKQKWKPPLLLVRPSSHVSSVPPSQSIKFKLVRSNRLTLPFLLLHTHITTPHMSTRKRGDAFNSG